MKPGWTLTTVGEVSEQVRGVTYAKPDARTEPAPEYLPLLRAGNIVDGLIDRTDLLYVPVRLVSARQMLRADDVLVATSSGSLTSVGKSARVSRGGDATFGAFCKALRPNSSVDPKYFAHYFNGNAYRHHIQARAAGANINNLRKSDLDDLPIPLPSLNEQRRIAAILDHVNALRALRKDALAVVGSSVAALFDTLFGPASELTSRWPSRNIRETGEVQLGRQRSPKYLTGKHARPYLRVANVQMNALSLTDVLEMDFDEREFPIYRLEHGDILLNEGQNTEFVGRPAMWRGEITDCCFQNSLVRYRADREQVIPEFALHVFLNYLRMGVFARISAKTSNMAHLGAGRFADLPFPLPPIELQREFATRLNVIDGVGDYGIRHLVELDSLFASIQARAFAGELDVDNVALPPA